MVIRVGIKDFQIRTSDKPSEPYCQILEKQGWKCRWCDISIANSGRIHHKDGNSDNYQISNLVALCENCFYEAKQIIDDNLSYLGLLFR